MKQQRIGYARVSTTDQNLDRQLDMLQASGVEKIYTEKMSGTKRERPEFSKMLERLEEADTVVIESLSRLGCSTKDLIELIELLESKGVQLVTLKESIDTHSSTGKLLFTIMSALAQFERDVIADRTKDRQSKGAAGGEAIQRKAAYRAGDYRADRRETHNALSIYQGSSVTKKSPLKIVFRGETSLNIHFS